MAAFFIVYCLMVLVFALFARAQLGSTFPQYHSVGRAFRTMFFYAMGFSQEARVNENFFPEIEGAATKAMAFHLAAFIVLVIFLFNVFTGIAMNCYSLAIDLYASRKGEIILEHALWFRAKVTLGFNHDLEEETKVIGGRPQPVLFRGQPPLDSIVTLEEEKPSQDPAEVRQAVEKALENLEEFTALIRRVRD